MVEPLMVKVPAFGLAKTPARIALRGLCTWPVIDEVALVELLRENPMFRIGLDVFEDEPYMKASLAYMKNVVVVPT
ncbi:Glyoxylate/hydroxypyruvate reductase B [Capsicum baccatum]|uniref:Glyoxylate/hydroxypyruvate reductase B n=1 Tax=Capsicum baccatum TaxID=33114 RepID=A0A2G2XCZ8_CAPBA|nr:Glyoxylate/hydroxypyruvate reductase B [Capsicum baccatum]